MSNVRPSEKGTLTIYAQHGVWYDADTRHIHVTIPGTEEAHWSYPAQDKKCAIYERLLRREGRWPEGARSAELRQLG